MPFSESLPDFFADFATPATLQGVAVSSGVIFDAEYFEPLGGFVEGRAPIATVVAGEVPAVAQGQTLVIPPNPSLCIAGGTYKVRGVQPDGTGIAVLKLEEQ
jgi:hypothetical protein